MKATQNGMVKRLLALVLALVLMSSLVPDLGLITTAKAATEITYIDENGAEQKTSSYNTLQNFVSSLSGTYYVTGSVYTNYSVSLSGDTTLILANGASASFNYGISGSSRNLRIYNEKGGTGTVTIKGMDGTQGDNKGTAPKGEAGGTGGTGTDGTTALSVKSLAISNVTVTCTGGAGGDGGKGGIGGEGKATAASSAKPGGTGGNGGNGGNGVILTGDLTIYSGTLNATGSKGGTGGNGGQGGVSSTPMGNPGSAGAGGTGGYGGSAIVLNTTGAQNINLKGNATLNAAGGAGGAGGRGATGRSEFNIGYPGGAGGNGGSSKNTISAGTNNSKINITSGKATIQSGNAGSKGSGGSGGWETYSYNYQAASGADGSPGSRGYAIGGLSHNFDSLPEKKGGIDYTATGWNSGSVSGYYYIYAANPPYKVTLNPNGGNNDGTASVEASKGSAMPAIEALPTRTGYTFGGYFDTNAATGGNQYYNAEGGSAKSYDKSAALTLYARWTPNEYKITFDKNSGSGGSVEVTQKFGEDMASITMPTKPGYHSTGYYDSKGDGKQYYTGDGGSTTKWDKATDTTLYAHWLPNPYKTQYWSQDDRESAQDDAAFVSEESMTYGKFTLKSAAALGLTRTHYDFIGWNLYQDQDWAMYQAGKEYSGGLTTEENGTAVIYAAWKEKPQFTVTYDANGGAGLPENASVYRDDDYTISSTKPTRDGYTFTGWKSGSTAYAAGGKITNVQANITLTAQWQRNNSVSYHPNGGSYAVTPETKYPAKGEEVTVDFTNKPTREGYTFQGYATSADAASAAYTSGSSVTMGTSSITLYAVWAPESYNITFSGCDGRYSFNGTKPDTVERDKDYSFTLKIADTYNTDNLAVTVNGLLLETPAASISGNYKLYTYTVKKVTGKQNVVIKGIATTPYKISYVLNGGSIVGEYATYYEELTGATLPVGTNVQRSGYTFAGWFDNEGCTGDAVTVISTAATGDKTFYAKWTANPYTIQFDANGGSDAPAQDNTQYDAVVNLPDKGSMTNGGYAFLGWDTNKNAIAPTYKAGDAVKNLTATKDAAVTLYAIWDEEHYSVTYHINGGVMQNTFALIQTVKHGGIIKTPANTALKKTGNEFLGWATSEGSAIVAYGHNADITVNGNMDLYAVWQAGSYTITYYNGEDTIGTPQDMTFGTPAALRSGAGLEAPDGKEFLGWSRSSTANTAEYVGGQQVTAIGDGTVNAVNLYAVWGDKTAKYLTYNANGGRWVGSVPDSVVDYGDGSVTLAAYDSGRLSRPGYTRDGWLVGSKKYADGATFVITENTTVFANWVANTYTVKFNANGGSGAMNSQSMTYDVEKALTANSFTRTGYTFKGWARRANGPLVYTDGESVLNLTNLANSEVNLYAVWEAAPHQAIEVETNCGAKVTFTSGNVDDGFLGLGKSRAQLGKEVTFTVSGIDANYIGVTVKLNGTTVLTPTGGTYKFVVSDKNVITIDAAGYKYTVTYQANGEGAVLASDTSLTEKTVTYTVNMSTGAVTPALEGKIFTRVGYKLAGWAERSKGSVRYELNEDVNEPLTDKVGGDVDLYAVWEKDDYKVTFAPGDGAELLDSDGNKQTEMQIQYSYDAKLGAMPIPTKTGYTFKGWYKDETPVTKDTVVTGSMTLTAKWQVNSYKIATETNCGANVSYTSGNVTSGKAEYGKTVTFKVTDVDFNSYNEVVVKINGVEQQTTVTSTNAGTAEFSFTVGLENTISIVKKNYKYYVAYDKNGGNGVIATQTVIDGEAFALADGTGFTKDDAVLQGWATTPKGAVVYELNSNQTKALTAKEGETVTLYAVWKSDTYTFNFNSDGGSAVKEFTRGYNDTLGTLPVPTKTGYHFDGWFLADNTEVKAETVVNAVLATATNFTKSEEPVDGVYAYTIPLTAHWTINAYNVTVHRPDEEVGAVTFADPQSSGTVNNETPTVSGAAYNTEIEFTVTPAPGYQVKDLVVTANGTPLKCDKIETNVGAFHFALKEDTVLLVYDGGNGANYTVSVASYTNIYDGENHTLEALVAPTGLSNITYQWYVDNHPINGATQKTYKVKNVADSGTYKCVVKGLDPKNGNTKQYTSNDAEVSITRKTVTVGVVCPNIYYGQPKPNFSITYSGFAAAETKSVVRDKDTITVDCAYVPSSAKGSYTATPVISGISADNYTFVVNPGTLVVNARPIVVSWSRDPANPWLAVTARVVNLFGSDTLDLTLTGNVTESFEPAQYTAKVTGISGNDNYTLTGGSNLVHNWSVFMQPEGDATAVWSVELDQHEAVLNGELTLVATVYPDEAANKTVSWSSSDTNVATVVNGVVTEVGEGTAVITVTTEDGGYMDSCVVTVEPDYVPVFDMTLDRMSAIITTQNGTVQLNPIITGSSAKPTFTSSDEIVATVGENGLITGLSTGSATITATLVDGENTATATCDVIVFISDTKTVASIDETALNGTYLITYTDGSNEYMHYNVSIRGGGSTTQQVQQQVVYKGGSNGKDGVGIRSIEKTGTKDNIDTYTITYTDGTTSTFIVTNGVDGHTPVITIGDNGNWFIDGIDSGKNAVVKDGTIWGFVGLGVPMLALIAFLYLKIRKLEKMLVNK